MVNVGEHGDRVRKYSTADGLPENQLDKILSFIALMFSLLEQYLVVSRPIHMTKHSRTVLNPTPWVITMHAESQALGEDGDGNRNDNELGDEATLLFLRRQRALLREILPKNQDLAQICEQRQYPLDDADYTKVSVCIEGKPDTHAPRPPVCRRQRHCRLPPVTFTFCFSHE